MNELLNGLRKTWPIGLFYIVGTVCIVAFGLHVQEQDFRRITAEAAAVAEERTKERQKPAGLDTMQGRAALGFGLAYCSWYGNEHHGRMTAAGAHKSKLVPEKLWRFDRDGYTFAHRTLPFGTKALFHLGGRWVLGTCTDRGPYPGPQHGPREFDISEAMAEELGFRFHGTAFVEVLVLP